MSFDYRVMKKVHTDGVVEYTMHEVYYDEIDGEVIAWSERPIEPYGQTLDELRDDVRALSAALNKPALDLNELEKKFELISKSSYLREEDTY